MRVFSEVSSLTSLFNFLFHIPCLLPEFQFSLSILPSGFLFNLLPFSQKCHHAMIERTRSFDVAISRCCRTKVCAMTTAVLKIMASSVCRHIYNTQRNVVHPFRSLGVAPLRARFTQYTGLFEMIVGVLTTCHTQYT